MVRYSRHKLAVAVGVLAAVLAVAWDAFRRGLPDFWPDWISLTVAAIAVGLAAGIVFAWLRARRPFRRA